MTRVIVEADGGSRGNPGPAGYGAVVWDSGHGRVLAERKESIGVATNNVAEYRGLIAGLAAAAELGASEVDVRMDSKLVVEQMSGRWKVKHTAMIPLAGQARQLVSGFDIVRFQWIPRADNSHADRLANEAMDDAPLIESVRAAESARVARSESAGASPGSTRAAESAAARPRSARAAIDAAQSAADGTRSASGTRSDSGVAGSDSGVVRSDPAAAGSDSAAVVPSDSSPAERAASAIAGATGSGGGAPAASGGPGWSGAVGRPTRLLLLRHGQTELSIQRRYSGRGNPPLTALGREQAARAAEHLAAKGGIAAVVSSPLERAQETATAAARALDVPVRVLDGLIETDFGEWEGLTFSEAAQRDPEVHAAWLGDPSLPPPGGESFDRVRERVEQVRRDLAALYPERNVLVVSHVTPIKTLLQLALGVGPSLLYRLHLDLASLSIAEFYPDGGSSVRLVNETSYL
ncbi:bifunctional RNase H/acid phosphatase [Nocardia sp. alder85J]|uniref:bifunctional RNase H/acid phosphatase n=1 Tax=Nocardia sp. alder85J TaxID=2862949 RepID=UPI001CD29242|nr:bifunctional RNase H/acid phosphatase [Nocardia sp. alder85J]MCX4098637.1 bifunctional RNase H/acid phosphatase [Nocardia sp. alder85J]